MFRSIGSLVTNKWVQGTAALLALGLAIYTTLHQPRPQIEFEILANSSVLSVPDALPNLEVLYDGKKLESEGKTIRLITIRIRNTGDRSIRNDDYDPRSPLGFRLSSGTLVNSSITSASNDYLREHCTIEKTAPTSAVFSPVFLEPESYFDVRLLVIAGVSETPDVIPTGKILDVAKATVKETYREVAEQSFYQRTFAGGGLVQIARTVAYAFVALLSVAFLMVLTGIPSGQRSYHDDLKIRNARIQIVNKYIAETGIQKTPCNEFLFSSFIDQRGPDEDPDPWAAIFKIAREERKEGTLGELASLHLDFNWTLQSSNVEAVRKRLVELGCVGALANGSFEYERFLAFLDRFFAFLAANHQVLSRKKRRITFETFSGNAYKRPAVLEWAPKSGKSLPPS
jgi:hypothetical protein